MRAALTLISVLSLTVSALAAERIPSFPKRTSYDDARNSLRALGWAPVVQTGQRCGTDGCYERCAPGFEARCLTYPETAICRGTGLAACEFLWKRNDVLIEIRTIGEDDPPTVAGVSCKVNCR